MTAYNDIADSDVDPESPGTTTTFTRLRDNPIAITEGSSGAPKIQEAALNDEAVTYVKLVNCAYTTDADYGVGSKTNTTHDTTSWAKFGSITAPVDGYYNARIRLQLDFALPAYYLYGRVYKDGVAYGTERSVEDGGDTTWNESLFFSAGERIQLYGRISSASSGLGKTYELNVFATLAPAGSGNV